jgi:hypothetical protein
MTDDRRYKVEDAVTRALGQLHAIENRLVNVAFQGDVSEDVVRQVESHCEDIAKAFRSVASLGVWHKEGD